MKHIITVPKKATKESNMFPFFYKKTIETLVPYGDGEPISEILMQTLVQKVQAEDPARFVHEQNQIAFAGGSPVSWRLLGPISYGEIKVVAFEDRVRVSYKLGFTGLFIISMLLVLAMAVFAYSSDFPFQNKALFAYFWVFLFGGNYALTVVRFEALVQSAITKAVYD